MNGAITADFEDGKLIITVEFCRLQEVPLCKAYLACRGVCYAAYAGASIREPVRGGSVDRVQRLVAEGWLDAFNQYLNGIDLR